MRSVWLSPGFPAAPAALLDSLGADYTLAPPSATPPAGSIAVVTGFERDLLGQLATRPTDTSLVVVTPPDAPMPANEVSELRPDAVVAAASIAEVATALRRLPAPATPATADTAGMAETATELPWWIRPSQDTPPATPASGVPSTHDTAAFATTPLPAFGQPVDPSGAPATETLAMGTDEPPRRRFALTGRRARIVSIAAVVIAVAATGVAVALDQHSSPTSNTAANSPLGSTNNGGNKTSPFGNSNGSNGSNGGNGQGNGTTPQFGNQNPFSGQSGQGGTGTRREAVQQFLACLKQNGVTINGNNFRSLDPTDPKLRTALEKCAPLMPFGRFGDRFGGSSNGKSMNGSSNSTGTTGTGTSGARTT